MSNRVVVVELPPIIDFYPENTQGDVEFLGDPTVHLEVALYRRVQRLDIRFSISFVEDQADFTVYQGEEERTVFDCDVECPGWKLASVIGGDQMTWSWNAKLVGDGKHTVRGGGLVRHAILQCGEWSGVFGGADQPAIVGLTFHPIQIELEHATPLSRVQLDELEQLRMSARQRHATPPWNELPMAKRSRG